MIIIITIIIKYRGKSKTPATINTELLVTLYKGRKWLTNITKSSISGVVWVLYALLKWHSSLNLINRGRPCPSSSLSGILPHVISQEYL